MVDLAEWLAGLGLGKYTAAFAAQEIDIATLPLLTDADLRELGLPIGPRRRLLAAIAALRDDTPPGRPEEIPRRGDAERRQLTVMFVDLANSTSLAARLDPEATREVLRAYQNAVAGEIGRVDGYVAKLMGDGVLAYFGWPQAHEDDAERAARAGLAIAAVVGTLTSPFGEPLVCRVGIATGLVVVGDLIGEGAAQEHAVVGTTPNLAARLQEAAGPGEVLIAPTTRRLIGAGFAVEPITQRLLKGHDEPVPLFRVLAHEPGETRFGARAAALLGPLVGRAAELGRLLGAWEKAQSGAGQVIVLAGEPGIGKSRLLRALADAAAEDAAARLVLQCSSFHRESPFWPILQQLATAAAIEPGDDRPARKAKLRRYLGTRVADPKGAVALLMPLLAGPDAADDSLPAGPQRRQATISVLIEQLMAPSSGRPGILIVEDAQWADLPTVELLRALVAAIGGAPMLLVVTTRGTGEPRLGAAGHLMRIALTPLDRPAAAALVASISGVRPLAARLVNEILARSDGVPLFIEEITRAVIEAVPSGETLAVPTTLRDSLIARLDVSPPMKAAAQIAACIGRDFDHQLLMQIADIPPGELHYGLDALLRTGLVVRQGERAYTFKNALICDIAYETLLTPRRRELHRQIAEAIEAMLGDRAQREPELLARHWFAAGEGGRAEFYWLRARHRAAHWQEQLDALADYLESADGADQLHPAKLH